MTLLSLSSGMPLGLVLVTVPAWMAYAEVDIRTIGILTVAQAPYAFKFLWSPLLDRYALPGLGRKRGWVLVCQLLLAALTGLLAFTATDSPDVAMVAALTLLIALASATQDIAVDAYAVEVLRPGEQGLAVGARTALYRVGMWMAGNIALSLGALSAGEVPWGWLQPFVGWRPTLLALAVIYLALLPVTIWAPEPKLQAPPPRTLKEAVWGPLVGFFRQHRALEIAAFVFFYKLADNLAGALVRPFLAQAGYAPVDVGLASGTIGLVGTLAGTFAGGMLTGAMGLGRSLWVFGILQGVSNVGYALVAASEVSRPLMYGAMAVESATSGMGTGAFGVLLLRMTEKRFSATQYALFSSIFALGRTVVGPPAGFLADALGWHQFFLLTIPCALPGLWMLHRFVPLTARDVPLHPIETSGEQAPRPLSWSGVIVRSLAATGAATLLSFFSVAGLGSLKSWRAGEPLVLAERMTAMLSPTAPIELLEVAGPMVAGLLFGLAAAAYLVARRGIRSSGG